MSNHVYKAYALTIASAIELPELEQHEGEPEVTISLGPCPPSLGDAPADADWFQASEDQCWLDIDEVARFHIISGRAVTIEPYPGAHEDDIRIYLLGSAMAALLHQRGYLVLHGAAMVINDQALIFTGESGIGKSTLAAALHNRGYEVLCDDVCVITFDAEESPLLLPGIPRIKLWADSARQLGHDTASLPKLSDNYEKYGLKITASKRQTPVQISRIYELLPHDTDGIVIDKLDSLAKLETVIENTFRYEFLEAQGVREMHFRQSAALSRTVNAFKLFRPGTGFDIDGLIERLETEFTSI